MLAHASPRNTPSSAARQGVKVAPPASVQLRLALCNGPLHEAAWWRPTQCVLFSRGQGGIASQQQVSVACPRSGNPCEPARLTYRSCAVRAPLVCLLSCRSLVACMQLMCLSRAARVPLMCRLCAPRLPCLRAAHVPQTCRCRAARMPFIFQTQAVRALRFGCSPLIGTGQIGRSCGLNVRTSKHMRNNTCIAVGRCRPSL